MQATLPLAAGQSTTRGCHCWLVDPALLVQPPAASASKCIDTPHRSLAVQLTGLLAYFVAASFLYVYELATDTILMCFCQACPPPTCASVACCPCAHAAGGSIAWQDLKSNGDSSSTFMGPSLRAAVGLPELLGKRTDA